MTFQNIFTSLLAAGALCVTANASTLFNFENDNLGTATNFTDTVNGVSATFSSAADPGGFVIYPSVYQTLTGNVLGDPGPAGADNLSLAINFNQNIGAIALNFATSDFTNPSPLTLTAYENSHVVGSATATGNFLPGFSFPEGEIAFNGFFNQVVLSSAATDLAVDNIAITTATPEPDAAALFAIGLLAVGAAALRRNSGRAQQN